MKKGRDGGPAAGKEGVLPGRPRARAPLHAVVMAGGSGTRFWPLSRSARPKQFLALAGPRSLLAETVARLHPLVAPEHTWVVCGRAHARAAREAVPEIPNGNLLVEPCARNTAPCVGLAALHVSRRDPGAVMAVLPADHHVARPAAFRGALSSAAALAARGALVTLGLRPTRPETGYGYLELGPPLAGRGAARKVKRFVEKPDAATAARYLAGGEHLWNAGIFVFRADVILAEIARFMPELGRELDLLAPSIGTPRERSALARAFPRCPAVSIDYGVMERSERIAVLPVELGWSDVGSFAALSEVRPRDQAGNVAEGAALILDGRDNVVLAGPRRPLVLVGLDDVIAVDAGDAVLVCRRDRAQDVKRAVDALRQRGREELL